MIRIGGLEAIGDDHFVFCLIQGSVFVGVGLGQILCRENATQFFLVERTVVIGIEDIEPRICCLLYLVKAQRSVLIGVPFAA